MTFFQATFPFIVYGGFVPLALLFMRVILAMMFIDSGRRHIQDPVGRAKNFGLSVWFTYLLGLIELIGGVMILVGLFTQLTAMVLSGVMLGAIYFKMFVWNTGMYGEHNDGWYYDALLLAGTGVLFAIGGGDLIIHS